MVRLTLVIKLMAKRKFGQYTPSSSGRGKRRRIGSSGMVPRNLFGTVARRAVTAVGRRYAGRMIGNMVGRVHPYAGAAWRVGRFAYRAYQGYKKWNSSKTKKAAGSPKVYNTSGHWQGKFKRVTKAGARTKFDTYNKVGVVHSTETIGSVTDNDCVYIVNEVINSRDVIKYMVAAVFRKLLEKAGIRVQGMDRSPFDKEAGDSNELQYHITVIRQNHFSGAQTVTTKDILAADSFNDMVDFFKNLFEQYCSGFGELHNQNMDEPHKVTLWTGPNDGSTVTILSQMLFNEVFVDIYGTAQLKVQNRTKATGGSEDAENINNNPLQGWSYLFNGVPKAKANGRITGGANAATVYFERMAYPKGVQTFGGNLVAMAPDFKEPPFPKQFWNCFKASNIRLEPGAMKMFATRKSKRGNFLKILKSIRLQLDLTGGYSTYSIFPVQMIAMEDVINANAAETISVQYEVQRVLGVKCWTKEKKYFTTDYELRT